MNLNFIELLAILQLIAIQNSSNGNNTKPQAIKGLVKFVFCTRLTKRQLILFCLWSSSALKRIHCGPWPKKVVHLWYTVSQNLAAPVYVECCLYPSPSLSPFSRRLPWLQRRWENNICERQWFLPTPVCMLQCNEMYGESPIVLSFKNAFQRLQILSRLLSCPPCPL